MTEPASDPQAVEAACGTSACGTTASGFRRSGRSSGRRAAVRGAAGAAVGAVGSAGVPEPTGYSTPFKAKSKMSWLCSGPAAARSR